ncbi:MAG: YegP family protein [Methanomassiliicoccaceae archaeon]|nr:YegP family protein [Methanomassiliicoccaceae archaeon]
MGKFVMKPAAKDGMMFNLYANNGRVICTSQVYANEATCLHGIESVKTNSRSKIEDQTIEGYKKLTNPKYEIFMDKGDKYRFHLKAMNGEIVAASQGYKSKESCMKGIESISKNAPDAPIVKEEE